MTIYIKRSTDVGAPALAAAAGSMITLLDFLLVTTLGWTKPYTGTNLAAYRQPAGTNQFYLRVDDTSTTTARIVGYESMTDVNTGSGPFPTAAQIASGLFLEKGAAAPWKFFSDGKIIYLFVRPAAIWYCTVFGDPISYKAADGFFTLALGQAAAANATVNFSLLNVTAGQSTGHYIARPYTQIGSCQQGGKFSDAARTGGLTSMGSGGSTYPNPIEGSLLMAPAWISEGSAANGARGLLPGVWVPGHSHPLPDGDTFSGTGVLTGRTFEAVDLSTAGTQQCFIETSDTWGGF